MPRMWWSLRRISYRSLTAVLVVSLLALSLHTLVYPRPWASLLQQHEPEPEPEPEYGYRYEHEHEHPEGRPHLATHTLMPDGRLLVNPDGPHPIFQLIRDAEDAWAAKRARASRSLDEAIAEYRRRYRRAPPLGFDRWWHYVVTHHVLLPDEYDEIFEDIEPFWGIDPRELARTVLHLETLDGVVTVEKTAEQPRLEVAHHTLPEDQRDSLLHRLNEILALVREIEHELPPLRITFGLSDNPRMLSDWQIKSMALEAAANGTILSHADLPQVVRHGWVQACPPDSPARLHPPPLESPPPLDIPPPSSPKTFIASHRAAMDPCMNPSLLTTHGQFLSHKQGPWPQHTLVPRFSLCATLLHHDIRPPNSYGWAFSQSDSDSDADGEPEAETERDAEGAFQGDLSWDRKTNAKLGWRGRTTGMHASPERWWQHGHRARLVTLASALEGNVSVLRGATESWEQVGEPESVSLTQANKAWMDVAFTEGPIGCNQDAGTCDEMARLWAFRDVQSRGAEGQYKFIFDVDGNGWSGRFKRLMTSNALIFKATIYPEWYTSRIAPWVHYVPIQTSYADLYDAVSFFQAHDALARRIARAGRAWSRRYWRKADLTAYFYRLLLEYARVTSLDRAAMDYVG